MSNSDADDSYSSFEFADGSAAAKAREERIAAARAASSSYSAKIEEPSWFSDPAVTARSKPGPARPDLFALQQLYVQKDFSEVVKRGLILSRKLKKVAGADEVEIVDTVLRAALRSGAPMEKEVVELARRYKLHSTFPSLALSASLLFAHSPPVLVKPTEALEAILAALSKQHSLTPYVDQLSTLLETASPILAGIVQASGTRKDFERGVLVLEVKRLGLSEEGNAVLERMVQLDGMVVEEEAEAPRDVRNL